MFGRRKREEAAAEEAAREADRHALFAKLAQRPEHICPFLGLAGDRTGHVDGISDEHRCFAFGDPAPISAEQQTRVCQERGYGNCPRYLRGVLVIPTEELEALRRPRQPEAAAPPPPPPQARSRRAALLPIILGLVLLVAVGGGAALYLSGAFGPVASVPSPSSTPATTTEPSVEPSTEPTESATASVEPTASGAEGSPTPEPTPVPGDEFAFYEVSVGPGSYTIYFVDQFGSILETRTVGFDDFSFARASPISGEGGDALWVIQDGDLSGYAYDFPESGEFRVRAVFLAGGGERRSFYLEDAEMNQVPQETPAPIP